MHTFVKAQGAAQQFERVAHDSRSSYWVKKMAGKNFAQMRYAQGRQMEAIAVISR